MPIDESQLTNWELEEEMSNFECLSPKPGPMSQRRQAATDQRSARIKTARRPSFAFVSKPRARKRRGRALARQLGPSSSWHYEPVWILFSLVWCLEILLTNSVVLLAPGFVAHSSRIHWEYAPHSRLASDENPVRITSNQLRDATLAAATTNKGTARDSIEFAEPREACRLSGLNVD